MESPNRWIYGLEPVVNGTAPAHFMAMSVVNRSLHLPACDGTRDAIPILAMNWLDLLQWPAMAVTVISAWMVASKRIWKRNEGFWLFVLSNILWTVWALKDHAYALVFLQVCLAALNIRGILNNRSSASK